MPRFRWNRITAGDGSVAEVNMTPLIDVSLVLVVILLLATPLAFEASFGLGRTATANTDAGEEAVVPKVKVGILSDTEVDVNGTVVAVEALPAFIAPLITLAEDKEVAVHCADAVSHGTFVQVLDITKLSGAMGIAVAREGEIR